MSIEAQFNLIAKEYDANRKKFIPCFNDYYENGKYRNYIHKYFKYLDKGIKAVNKTQKSKLFS